MFLLGRFFAQRAGGFVFAGRGGDDLPTFGLQAFEVRVHPGEQYIHIVTALGSVFGADAVNFFKNLVLFHGLQFHQFGGSANIRDR